MFGHGDFQWKGAWAYPRLIVINAAIVQMRNQKTKVVSEPSGHRDMFNLKSLALAGLMLGLMMCTATAETFNYSCKVAGKTYPLRVDDKTNILEWRGKKYSITVAGDDDIEDACAKYGWIVKGNGRVL